MSQEPRNTDLENEKSNPIVNFLQSFSAFIIGFLGLATAIYQFIQLFLGDRENFTLILGGLGYLTILASLIYVGFSKTKYLAKTAVPPQWFMKMTYENSYKNAQKGLIFLFVATLVSGAIIYKQDKERQDKFVIMVAEFDGPDTQNYRLTEKLLFKLNESLNNYDDALVIPLNKRITEQDGSLEAQKIAKKYRADLLIWGWYGLTESDTTVTIHIENLSVPKNITIPSSAAYTVQSPIAEINNFHLQQKISDGMTALSLFISGIAWYENGNYTEAVTRLTTAYEIGAWPDGLSTKSVILFYRGNAHLHTAIPDLSSQDKEEKTTDQSSESTYLTFNNSELALAAKDYSLAIESNPAFEEAYINRGETNLLLYETWPEIEDMKSDNQSPLSDFNKALEMNPNNFYAHNARGRLFLFSDEYSSAISDFSQAIEIGQPTHSNYSSIFSYDIPEAYTNRGISYERSEKFDKAILDYE